jgi:hypothetical protein
MAVQPLLTIHPTVSTLGYAALGSAQVLEQRMEKDPKTLLIDIRFLPVSRWRPFWRKCALKARYGNRYIHLRGLGNVNYKHWEKGIQLYDPTTPLLLLRGYMQEGYSLILLCACQDPASCHRSTVYDLLMPSHNERIKP